MELDAAAWPLHSAGLPLTAKQPISSNPAIGRDAQCREIAVGQEDQASAGPQEPGGLGQPAFGVAPGSHTVLADHEVEEPTGQRDLLGIRMDQREGGAEPGLEVPRG